MKTSPSSRPAMGAAVQPPSSTTIVTITTLLGSMKPLFSSKLPTHKSITILSSKPFNFICYVPRITTAFQPPPLLNRKPNPKPINHEEHKQFFSRAFLGAGLALALVVASNTTASAASEFPFLADSSSSLQFNEPQNALSLPTWAVHVSSVVEWITAMILIWQYGEKSGFESWKGLSWGMVPLLGGAFCACTWHFFYNSESLSVLVALQAALTVIGNFTMCIAAFHIWKSSQEGSQKL